MCCKAGREMGSGRSQCALDCCHTRNGISQHAVIALVQSLDTSPEQAAFVAPALDTSSRRLHPCAVPSVLGPQPLCATASLSAAKGSQRPDEGLSRGGSLTAAGKTVALAFKQPPAGFLTPKQKNPYFRTQDRPWAGGQMRPQLSSCPAACRPSQPAPPLHGTSEKVTGNQCKAPVKLPGCKSREVVEVLLVLLHGHEQQCTGAVASCLRECREHKNAFNVCSAGW